MAKDFDFSDFKNYNMMNVIRPLCNAIGKVKYKVEIIGSENLDRPGGYIIASNHVSALDPMFIGMSSKRLFHYIAKKELFENPVMNVAMKHMNAFPVIRGVGDMKAVNYAIELVKRGEVLVIFPEGTRSPDGSPKEAKSGVAYIARTTESDVVPCAIHIDKETSKAIVKFGKAIKYAELGMTVGGRSKENKQAAAYIMDEIKKLWEECE